MNNSISQHTLILCGAICLNSTAFAQSGGPYTLNWSTIDGGGADCAGGSGTAGRPKFALTGTVGQPDAGNSIASHFVQLGGFLSDFARSMGPPLEISRSSGDFILSWPDTCVGFHLEASPDVAALTWADLGAGLSSGSERRMTVAGTANYRFFRLRKDCPR